MQHHLRGDAGERAILEVIPKDFRLICFHGERIPVDLVPEKSVMVWSVPFNAISIEAMEMENIFGFGLQKYQRDLYLVERNNFNQDWELMYNNGSIVEGNALPSGASINYPIASLFKPKNVFYIHFDLLHSNSNVNEISSEIFDAFLDRHPTAREATIKEIIKKQLEKGVSSKVASLSQLREQEKTILKNYASIIKTIQQLEIELLGYKTQERMLDETMKRELESLSKIEELEKFTFREDGSIEAHTKPIYIKGVYLGRFKIKIDGNANREDLIRMINKDNRRGDYDHPHVARGVPCLGNIHTDMIKLITAFEYAAAMQLAVNYLKSVQEGAERTHLDMWRK